MKPASQPQVELRDVARGLWIWRLEHPHWKPGQGWEPVVASTCVESHGETLLLDPLAPPEDAAEFWKRLDAHPPTAVVVLKPDHVRDLDLFARRYHAPAFGPRLFFREDIPQGRRVEAKVKWFNASKGFGFVTLADESQDAFLPWPSCAAPAMRRCAKGRRSPARSGPEQRIRW